MVGGLLPDGDLDSCVWDFFLEITESINKAYIENATL
jgi:hypothetical protein